MAVMNRKVLIVGCGSIGKRHAECLRDIGIKSLVFFDTDYEKSEKLAALYGGSTVGSYEEGLNTPFIFFLLPGFILSRQLKR